jgi:hypothetical protein
MERIVCLWAVCVIFLFVYLPANYVNISGISNEVKDYHAIVSGFSILCYYYAMYLICVKILTAG